MNQIPDVNVPRLSQFPFIEDSFAEAISLARHSDGACGMESEAQNISNSEVSAYHNLSDETFAALSTLLGLHTFGQPITRKEDVARLALEKHADIEEDAGCDVDLHDLEAFIVLSAGVKTASIRWDRIATLHNDSDDAGRQAIRNYFNKAFENDLAYTLAVSGPDFNLPPQLQHHEQGTPFIDKLFFKAPEDDRWIPEEQFHSRFKVKAVISGRDGSFSYSDPFIIGATGYLDEAIAMASLYVDKRMHVNPLKPSSTINSIVITLGLETVARANPTPTPNSPKAHQGTGQLKLIWDCAPPKSVIESLEERQQKLKSQTKGLNAFNSIVSHKFEELGIVARALELTRTPITHEMFKTARLKVEEALKLDWGKVHDLESALGL